MENIEKLCPKSVRGRLREVFLYDRFYLWSFDWKLLWSPMGGGRLQEVFPQTAQVHEC